MIQQGKPPVKTIKEKAAQTSKGRFEIGLGKSGYKLAPNKEVNVDMVDGALLRKREPPLDDKKP